MKHTREQDLLFFDNRNKLDALKKEYEDAAKHLNPSEHGDLWQRHAIEAAHINCEHNTALKALKARQIR
jgi:hypothetical protein